MNLRNILPMTTGLSEAAEKQAREYLHQCQQTCNDAHRFSHTPPLHDSNTPVPHAPNTPLLRCPFCGKPPECAFHAAGTLSDRGIDDAMWTIGCGYETCAAGPLVIEKSLPRALLAWNHRA